MNIPNSYLKNKYVRLYKAYLMNPDEKMKLCVDQDTFAFTPENSLIALINQITGTPIEKMDFVKTILENGIVSIAIIVIPREEFDDTINMDLNDITIQYSINKSPYALKLREYRISELEVVIDKNTHIAEIEKLEWAEIEPESSV